MKPLVSVCLITYQHERYLERSLDGVLDQVVDFDIEVVVGEDCSTDRTREIIDAYVRDADVVIRPLYRARNLGLKPNFIDTLAHCSGDFVAVLSGDDYWTDPYKLRKQVDFFRHHPDHVLLSTNALAVREGERPAATLVNASPEPFDFDTAHLMTSNPCVASQVMFRNHLVTEFPEVYHRSTGEDRRLYILLSQHGACRFDPDVTGVYRIHDESITVRRTSSYQGTIDGHREQIRNAQDWNEYLGGGFESQVAHVQHTNSLTMLRLAARHRDLATLVEAMDGVDPTRLPAGIRRSGFGLSTRALAPVARRLHVSRGTITGEPA